MKPSGRQRWLSLLRSSRAVRLWQRATLHTRRPTKIGLPISGFVNLVVQLAMLLGCCLFVHLVRTRRHDQTQSSDARISGTIWAALPYPRHLRLVSLVERGEKLRQSESGFLASMRLGEIWRLCCASRAFRLPGPEVDGMPVTGGALPSRLQSDRCHHAGFRAHPRSSSRTPFSSGSKTPLQERGPSIVSTGKSEL